MRTITDKWWRALTIGMAVAVGLSIALAIVAVGDGIDTAITERLGAQDDTQLKALGIDLGTIRSVLAEGRDLLIWLPTAYTVAIVGMVMWTSMPQRHREISLAIQEGQHRNAVMIELGVESLILCVAGCDVLDGRLLQFPGADVVSDRQAVHV